MAAAAAAASAAAAAAMDVRKPTVGYIQGRIRSDGIYVGKYFNQKVKIGVPFVINPMYIDYSTSSCVQTHRLDKDWTCKYGFDRDEYVISNFMVRFIGDVEYDECIGFIPDSIELIKQINYITLIMQTDTIRYTYKYVDGKLRKISILAYDVLNPDADLYLNDEPLVINVDEYPHWMDSGDIPVPPKNVSLATKTEVFGMDTD